MTRLDFWLRLIICAALSAAPWASRHDRQRRGRTGDFVRVVSLDHLAGRRKMSREVCTACGGWIDCGIEFATWERRKADFWKSHTHPAGAPQIYRWPGDEAARDAFLKAALALGLTSLGYGPLGGGILVANMTRPGAAGQPPDVLRIVARTPADIVA
jgi:hypothetical protein